MKKETAVAAPYENQANYGPLHDSQKLDQIAASLVELIAILKKQAKKS
jgi:hypothetical protein